MGIKLGQKELQNQLESQIAHSGDIVPVIPEYMVPLFS
jgi:hypothetical protein